MLEFDTPEALLRSRLAQHLERGSVTAFGTTLQSIAKDIGGEATGVGVDIMPTREGRHYYIQVKSGPDTANRDIASRSASKRSSLNLTNDFHARYGTTLDEASWQRFLADNS